MHNYEKEFDFVINRAKSLKRPARMVVAGADLENVLVAVSEAEKDGFCHPILVGEKNRIMAMLEKLGLQNGNYEICHVSDDEVNDDECDNPNNHNHSNNNSHNHPNRTPSIPSS